MYDTPEREVLLTDFLAILVKSRMQELVEYMYLFLQGFLKNRIALIHGYVENSECEMVWLRDCIFLLM